MAHTRMPDKVLRKFEGRLAIGRQSRMQHAYMKAIDDLNFQVSKKAMEWRNATDLATAVKTFPFSKSVEEWAEGFVADFSNRYQAVDNAFSITDRTKLGMNAFAIMGHQIAKRDAIQAVVADAVEVIRTAPTGAANSMADAAVRHYRTLAIYKHVIKHNLRDRVIFQPGVAGSICVMDLLMESMEYMAQRRVVGFLMGVAKYTFG